MILCIYWFSVTAMPIFIILYIIQSPLNAGRTHKIDTGFIMILSCWLNCFGIVQNSRKKWTKVFKVGLDYKLFIKMNITVAHPIKVSQIMWYQYHINWEDQKRFFFAVRKQSINNHNLPGIFNTWLTFVKIRD